MFCKLTVNFCSDILAVFLTMIQQIDTSFLSLSTARCTYLTPKGAIPMTVEICLGQTFKDIKLMILLTLNHMKLSFMYIIIDMFRIFL